MHDAGRLVERHPEIARTSIHTAVACGDIDGWQQLRMVELLGKYSRDVWSLTYNGRAGRLGEVLRDEPERARVSSPRGDTPLVLAAVALAASALPAWRAANTDALIPLREE